MIRLNGLAPIFGATLLHVVFINILAIIIEYQIIKIRYKGNNLLLKVIISNIISVLIGTIMVYWIPELMGGSIARPDDYVYNSYDKFALVIGVLCLFITNVIIETPTYLFGLKLDQEIWGLFYFILIANLVTNIPVVLVYLIFMN